MGTKSRVLEPLALLILLNFSDLIFNDIIISTPFNNRGFKENNEY